MQRRGCTPISTHGRRRVETSPGSGGGGAFAGVGFADGRGRAGATSGAAKALTSAAPANALWGRLRQRSNAIPAPNASAASSQGRIDGLCSGARVPLAASGGGLKFGTADGDEAAKLDSAALALGSNAGAGDAAAVFSAGRDAASTARVPVDAFSLSLRVSVLEDATDATFELRSAVG